MGIILETAQDIAAAGHLALSRGDVASGRRAWTDLNVLATAKSPDARQLTPIMGDLARAIREAAEKAVEGIPSVSTFYYTYTEEPYGEYKKAQADIVDGSPWYPGRAEHLLARQGLKVHRIYGSGPVWGKEYRPITAEEFAPA